MKLTDKVAIVTGSATGIGRATALALSREGAQVVVADCSELGKETINLIKDVGGEAIYIPADVSKPSNAQKIVSAAILEYGKLDILHNNAGILKLVEDISYTAETDWDQIIDINLKGVFLVSKFAIPHMKSNGGGAIVNTASMTGWAVGGVGVAAYCASKAGVIGLTKCMALELAQFNIRVNAVCPGAINTKIYTTEFIKDHSLEELEAGERYMQETIPMGRYGEPEEVAKAVVYLASDDSSYVTGQALVVDGGFSIQ